MIFLIRMNPVSGRQNFVVGNFDSVMGALASNPLIVFSFATSKAVPDKIFQVHPSPLIAWGVVVGGLQGRIKGRDFFRQYAPSLASQNVASGVLIFFGHFQSHLLPPLIKMFFFHAVRNDTIAS